MLHSGMIFLEKFCETLALCHQIFLLVNLLFAPVFEECLKILVPAPDFSALACQITIPAFDFSALVFLISDPAVEFFCSCF